MRSDLGLLHPLAAGAFNLPALTDWFTLAVAVTFAVAGLILLLVGWIVLPSAPKRDDPSKPPDGGSAPARVLGGIVLAVGGVMAGAYALAHETPWGVATRLEVGRSPGLVRTGLIEFGAAIWRSWGWLERNLVVVHADLIPVAHRGELGAVWAWGATSVIRGYAPSNVVVLLATAVLGGIAGWLSTGGRWRASGVITFLGVEFLALGLIGFSLVALEAAQGPVAQGLGVGLIALELFGLFLFASYQFYSMEFLAGRSIGESRPRLPADPAFTPTVLVQIASFNEPPSIVENSIDSVLGMRYPKDRFRVQLVDDSSDPALVHRLRAFCESRGVLFAHRTHRRGFKGGALNDGLRALGRPVELVAIVDADYVVRPEFLAVAVQPFRDQEIGFVQTPQGYRNAGEGTFARWYALADAYFYRVVQPVRERTQSMIFCGTMGLIRTRALASAGGWSEVCVTEDAELSLRLIASGWKGAYEPRPLGWGLAPNLLSAVRSQHWRWAFGGLQMLRLNRRRLAHAPLTLRQRLDFRMSGLFWTDGIFLLGVAGALTALVVSGWFGVRLGVGSTASLAILASAPLLLMVDGLMKIRWALRSSTPVTFRDTLGIMAFWYAIKLNDLRAALRGWRGASLSFHRTPKEDQDRPTRRGALGAALHDSALETLLSVTIASVAAVSLVRLGVLRGVIPAWPELTLIVWLIYYALCFASAPCFDYLSRRAVLPAPSSSPVARTPSPHVHARAAAATRPALGPRPDTGTALHR